MSDPIGLGVTGTPTGIRTRAGIHLGYASRGTRLLGQIIDSAIGSALLLVAPVILHFVGPLDDLYMMHAFGWACFYMVLADGLHEGQSFSKQWLGTRVVDANTGAACTFGQSFVRNITLIVLGVIDCIFVFGDRHQRLGDKIAGTIVVTAD